MPVPWALLLIAAASVIALYWVFVCLRVWSLASRMPTARSGLAHAPGREWPKVSVVVPAHNEERVIERCAASLLASEYPALEVVIVLDRCTDRTLEFLRPFAGRDPRLTIVENHACPVDWAGKCNAARVGAERSSGDYILFTDADVRFHPQLLKAAMGVALRDDRGLLSLLPTLTAASWYEQVVQPVAAVALLRMYPIDKVNRDDRRRPFANGQFLLFDRAVYEAIGGHAAVKDDLLEDLAFARRVEDRGYRGGLAIAEEMLEVHMYASLAAMRTGWKRIFIEACRRRVSRLRGYAARVAFIGVGAPLVQIAAVVAGLVSGGWWAWIGAAVVLAGLVAQAIALGSIYAASRTPVWGAILYPLGAAIVAKTLWDGAADLAHGKPVRWGGREYVLEPRQ